MQWIEDLVAAVVAAAVSRHGRVAVDHFYSVDVRLDRDDLKSTLPRGAVADVIESRELVLIDFDFLPDARIKATFG